MNNSNKNLILNRRGMTLFEILAVIAVMSVIVALAIPQVRNVSKDRQVREAARVVNSMFNDAIQRARAENNRAGVLLVKNDNVRKDVPDGMGGFVNRSVVSSTLFRLRQVDDYSGSELGDNMQLHYVAADMAWYVDIPIPLQSDVIQVGDSININGLGGVAELDSANISAISFVPATGTPNFMRLTVDVLDSAGNAITNDMHPDSPEETDEVPQAPNPNWMIVPDTGLAADFEDTREWVIERLPRIVESSRLDLPNGYYIFLEHSGFAPNPNAVRSRMLDSDESFVITFDESGGIDELLDQTGANRFTPFNSLNLLVGEFEPESTDPTFEVLDANESLWVTIQHVWGSSRVGVNNPPASGLSYFERMLDSRKLTKAGASARQ